MTGKKSNQTDAVCRLLLTWLLGLAGMAADAQPVFSQPHGLYSVSTLTVAMTTADAEAVVRYTTDGSEPTATSTPYTRPLTLSGSTVLRAADFKDGQRTSAITTASYLMVWSVMTQPDWPEGYPAMWGSYTQISGTATADYGMDPEMTGNKSLSRQIAEGLEQLPVLSIVTDKDNLFSHVNDPDVGGIYIFTGPPVGDTTGHGWTRPASIELFGGPQQHDLTAACGLRLHGGHGRLAEKNPKHSFRLVFKKEYGLGKLEYPVFSDGPARQEYDQLVLRCHFGNSWQHWKPANRTKAQYTRDVWARRMQRQLGHTSVNALYVHLFLNGMYWGMYNVAERVDDLFGKTHLGGKKSDIDVIKIEEQGGNHLEAGEGTLDAWHLMTAAVEQTDRGDDLQALDSLLDIPAFIDYMLINHYAGNNDWAHHNWYAIRRRGTDSPGFRFLCWDSEAIFEETADNVLAVDNGIDSPTGIFQVLLRNSDFSTRYVNRAAELLAADGPLGPKSVAALWDSLYSTVSLALYDEAARWGDYRRDVHPYSRRGELYTVDGHYQKERQRLLTSYFPQRSQQVLQDIIRYTGIRPSAIATVSRPHSDAAYYNLLGQKVQHPLRGALYVRQGRKIINNY